jgi:hypothetical protein
LLQIGPDLDGLTQILRQAPLKSRRSDSNRRHPLYKSGALPTELLRRRLIVGEVMLSILDTAQPMQQASCVSVDHPKAKGDRSTLAIMLALSEAGYAVLVPFGENTRYDLVIDGGESLKRVQCKTGSLRQGSIRFAACSSYAHHPNPRMVVRDYLDQIDYFGIYCPETRGVYLVPVEDAQVRRAGTLRVTPPRNGQKRRIRAAADYEIAQIAVRAIEEPGASVGAYRSSA